MKNAARDWYKDAVFYEVHVKAFKDANGDGIGDFAGLTESLDYIQELGVDCLWILPMYPSPLRDDGYDIADFYGIHPSYGTVEDFQKFLDAGYEHVAMTAWVERMEAERLFSFRWHPAAIDPKVDYSGEPTTLVEFRLEHAPGGTLLTVSESGFQALPVARQGFAHESNSGGWEEQLRNIERHVARHPSPRA